MNRNFALLTCIAGVVTAAVAVLTFSLGNGTRWAVDHAPERAAHARRAPAATPALAPAPEPVRVAAPRPTPFDATHVIGRDEAEQRLALALDRIERTVASVREEGDPPPTAHEARSLREDAVMAYLDLAASVGGREREQRYAAVSQAIARLGDLHDEHGDLD